MTNNANSLFLKVSNKIIENKKYLTKLDSAIGDGDHGINMAKGFKVINDKLSNNNFDNMSLLFKEMAMAMISNIGGASGPLFGTAFLSISKVIPENKIEIDDLVKMGDEAISGIKIRGKAEAGEKTMLDTIIPAVESLKKSKNNNDDLETSLDKCLKAAEKGMKSTIEMKATKGRASYLGERSIGHQDPGATSSFLIIETLIKEYKNE